MLRDPLLSPRMTQGNDGMNALIDGIHRFRTRAFPNRVDRFQSLAEGQEPHTLFITCSDSRVVPHLVTDAEPGELFVIRNAGNLVPSHGACASGEEAAIEYAVAVLEVQQIVVCGHSNCGAMKGLLNPGSLDAVPSVVRWLQHAGSTRAVVDATVSPTLSGDERLRRTIEINALRQLDNLRGHPSVAAALARGTVSLHAWVYDIGEGLVVGYDESTQRFSELRDELCAL